MYIPLSDDKHRFIRDSSLCALEIQDNFFLTIFSRRNFFLTGKYFSQIFSWTEFCLGLHAAVVFRKQSFNLIISDRIHGSDM